MEWQTNVLHDSINIDYMNHFQEIKYFLNYMNH